MTKSERIIAGVTGIGVLLAAIIGLLLAVFCMTQQTTLRKIAAEPIKTPVVNAKMGNVTVSINDQTSQEPPVLTTEQVADRLDVNADTVRRREAAGGLVGYAKRGRNTWVRVGPETGT